MTDSQQDLIINADRAKRLHAALELYNDECGVEANLVEMLADARHWCDNNCRDFASFDHSAYQHYLTERWNERRGRS